MPKTEVVVEPERLFQILSDPEIEVHGYLPVNDTKIFVSWAYIGEASLPSKISNVVLAAYTTAQARLALYEYLENLDRRALYYDTDSVIFSTDVTRDTYTPPTGEFLGQMTNELSEYGPGAYIVELACLAPKVYSFIVKTANNEFIEVCKVKGISLNYSTKDLINFNVMKSIALDQCKGPITVEYKAIRRSKMHEVLTTPESKTFNPVITKRRKICNHDSVPYGYIH